MNEELNWAVLFLTDAMNHLEEHNPECHGWKSTKPWWHVDKADQDAWYILRACRDLVGRVG